MCMNPVAQLEQIAAETPAEAPAKGGGERGGNAGSRMANAAPPAATPPPRKLVPEHERSLVLRLGMSFALLTMLTVSCWVPWRVMSADAHLEKSLTERREKLQLIYDALRYSTENSRVATDILLAHGALPELQARKAENRRRITDILGVLERRADSEEERQLVAAVKRERKIYLENYERGVKLLVEDKRRDLATAVRLNEATPSLFAYHAAWEDLAGFEVKQMQAAAQISTERDRATHRVGLSLQALSMFLMALTAVFTTRRIARDIQLRVRMQREVADLNAQLEQRVAQRTEELARAQSRLQESLAETREYTAEIQAVNELTKLLQSCLTLEEAYQQASRVLQQFFPGGSVLMLNSSRNLLDVVVSWGIASNKPGPFPPEGCWALRKGQCHLTGGNTSNPKCSHSDEGDEACRLCVPMAAQGSSLGILTIVDRVFCDDSGITSKKTK